ncbi:MAG: flagellar basal body rod protein FlgB [Candidatus Hydrogenedentes bacterium]|nr:flagellar basal body rod protein FlgB [Candidatus Hydrogenedentota bacterium]
MIRNIGNISAEGYLIAGLSVGEINHKYIANNIANVDTPGYSERNLDFNKTLSAVLNGRGGIALRTSHPRHIPLLKENLIFEEKHSLIKNDFNSVDIDEQILRLSENLGRMTVFYALLAKKYSQIIGAINELKR